MEERDDDFYFHFKGQWHSVSEYAPERLRAEILSHKQGKYEQRQSISQAEFEDICREVLSSRPNIIDCWFEEPGIVHVVYPSHSGKTKNGATLYFGEQGYITYKDGNTVLEAMRAFLSAKKSAERFNVLCMSKPIAT
jgi:hypothetical protein